MSRAIDHRIDAFIASTLSAARIPGAALAVVANSRVLFASGYGFRDLITKLPVTTETVYPIASTSKAINSTLLGMLVDEGSLAWDAPVQCYLPSFRLYDPLISSAVTVRDLITMRTGLPRHDLVWDGNVATRSEIVARLAHLQPSAGFRERYQYNNLTVTTAGHIAEIVTGRTWEQLVQARILQPLGMLNTVFTKPKSGNVTRSYHETSRRKLVMTQYLPGEVTAPSGGAIHSTMDDMARWLSFNLNAGKLDNEQLISRATFTELRAAQVLVGDDSSSPSPGATYAMGWYVDTYNGCARILHGGYMHDVHSNVMLFPAQGIGIVSYTNFGCPGLSRLINEHVFDLLMGLESAQTVEVKLTQYERCIEENRARLASTPRTACTSPSHAVGSYLGEYVNPGYGSIEIRGDAAGLAFKLHSFDLQLEHWHHDTWTFAENDMFEIHKPHPFDRASHVVFDVDATRGVTGLSIELEPAVSPIQFVKQA
jgi:CubicO group peptidase (beta-lactamase class C family)